MILRNILLFVGVFFLSIHSSSALELATISKIADLHLFPEAGSEKVAEVPAGTAIQILQRAKDWVFVEWPMGGKSLKGWVEASKVGEQAVPNLSAQPEAPWKDSRQISKNDARDDGVRLSLALNPVTILFPWMELQIGIALHPHFRLNITPQFMTWGYGNDAFDGGTYGGTLSGSIFFGRWSGWYLEPGAVFLLSSRGGGYWAGGQLIGGYEWEWSSGFFVNLGLGAGVGHFDDGSDGSDDWFDFSGTYGYPTGNLLVGYKF